MIEGGTFSQCERNRKRQSHICIEDRQRSSGQFSLRDEGHHRTARLNRGGGWLSCDEVGRLKLVAVPQSRAQLAMVFPSSA